MVKKCIVLMSGGPDCAVVAAMLKKKYDLYFLFMDYGQKSLRKEKKCAKELAKHFKAKDIKIAKLDFFKELIKSGIKTQNLIEQVTPEILKKEALWKGKKFRRYDVSSPVPAISGGKRHFVNQATDYVRKIWTDMGFQEMTGDMIQSSFWVFDGLFTAQDHPVRELQDTFGKCSGNRKETERISQPDKTF